ncbi:MAG: T9SS type A sorting domain-containing protein [Bacteroidia bacterium]
MNEDFEASPSGTIASSSSIAGWSVFGGTNLTSGGSCSHVGCCALNTPTAAIINTTGGYVDSYIGASYPIYSVFGSAPNSGNTVNPSIPNMYGNSVIRLNDQVGNYTASMLSKTFLVGPGNTLLEYAFISVVYPGHQCCDAPAFTINLYNASAGNSLIPCPSASVTIPSTGGCTVAPQPSTTFFSLTTTGYAYNTWKLSSFDLSAYAGSQITIEVVVTDCTAGGHFAYLYFDAQCSSPNFIINGNPQAVSGNTVLGPTCGAGSSATVTAPAGMDSYQWSGPGAFTSTLQTINTNITGTYTISMNTAGSCAPIVYTVNIVASPSVALNAASSSSLSCSGSPVTFTASAGSGVPPYTYTWSTGGSGSSIVVTPSVTTNYTVYTADSVGCTNTYTFTQIVSTCTTIDELATSSRFKLYPNPSNGEFILNLNSETGKAELSIENTMGQILRSQIVTLGENKVNIKNLYTGIYYYSIIENKRVIGNGKLLIE